MKSLKSGTMGWTLLTVYVIAWDFGVASWRDGETLSSAFWRATRHPVARLPVVLAWIFTTGHLFGFLPSKVDPYKILGRSVARLTNVRFE